MEEVNALDKMALTGLTEKEKAYLATVLPAVKREKIELLRKMDEDPKKKKKIEKKLEKKMKEDTKRTLRNAKKQVSSNQLGLTSEGET